jgi:hypothetical protein
MIDKFSIDDLHLFQKNNNGENAFDIALGHQLVDVFSLLNVIMNDEERNDALYQTVSDEEEEEEEEGNNGSGEFNWAEKEMPLIPNIEEKRIDVSQIGYDPFLLEERNIKEFIDEDKDNIVILYEGKNYLLSKSIITQQWEEGIVFECLKAEGIKNPTNIVQNLPLFNIKIIGIDIPTEKTGLWPEFIYLDGFQNILNSQDQLFNVIPLVDNMLVSVISLNEAKKVGSAEGSAYGSLHCQNGQGGMAGIIVPAKASISGGNRKKNTGKTITKKKKRYFKKSQKKILVNKKKRKKTFKTK